MKLRFKKDKSPTRRLDIARGSDRNMNRKRIAKPQIRNLDRDVRSKVWIVRVHRDMRTTIVLEHRATIELFLNHVGIKTTRHNTLLVLLLRTPCSQE